MKPLDNSMNKQHFVVDIYHIPNTFFRKIFPKKMGQACIWPSDNWVEIHLFEDINSEIRTYEVDYKYDMIESGGMRFFMKRKLSTRDEASWVDARYYIFNDRIKSFIIHRDKIFGNKKKVFCKEPAEEDFKRWNEWHPDDDYLYELFDQDVENTVQFYLHGESRIYKTDLENQIITTGDYDKNM